MSWPKWETLREKRIGVIRSFDRETIPMVAGSDWAYDLTPLHIDPIGTGAVGNVSHS